MSIAGDRRGAGATARPSAAVKLVIIGGFGVGKTTSVAAIADTTPLMTEVPLTRQSAGVDEPTSPAKAMTTAAMDFGRVTLSADLVVYVFGTPGLDRFLFLRDELIVGATGAVVLADPARIVDCFAAIDFVERRQVPYVVAVNAFDHSHIYTDAELRDSLQIRDDVPVLRVDVRRRHDVRDVLSLLVQHALSARRTPAAVLTQP